MNLFVQILAGAAQLLNVANGFGLPQKYEVYIAGSLAIVQTVAHLVAQAAPSSGILAPVQSTTIK